jgi:hypothetical protein
VLILSGSGDCRGFMGGNTMVHDGRTRVKKVLSMLATSALLGGSFVALGSSSASAVTTYSISGTVFLDTTATAAGDHDVFVTATATSGVPPATGTAYSDASGAWTISNLSAGSYQVYFQYVGSGPFGSRYFGGTETTHNASTVAISSSNVSGKNATLPIVRHVAGQVSYGSAANHLTGSVAISIDYYENYSWRRKDYSVTTDSSGNFDIPLVPGTYRFSFTPPAALSQYQRYQYGLDDGMGQPQSVVLTNANVSLEPVIPLKGSISGHVYLGSVATSAGANDVKVVLKGCSMVCSNPLDEVTTYTDANGDYSFSGLSYARYNVRFSMADGGYAYQTAAINFLTLSSSTLDMTGRNVTLATGASLSGHVTLGAAHAAAGAGAVTVTLKNGGFTYGSAQTDASGNYTIAGVPSGSYKIHFGYNLGGAYADQYYPNSGFEETGTTRQFTTTALTQDMNLPDGATISGTISDFAGAPRNHIHVHLKFGTTANPYWHELKSVYTNSDGSYEFSGLPAHNYTLEIGDLDFGGYYARGLGGDPFDPTETGLLSMSAGQTRANVDATMYRYTGLAITLACEACGPEAVPAGSTVELTRMRSVETGTYDYSKKYGIAGTLGQPSAMRTFDTIYPGTYKVRVLLAGIDSTSTSFTRVIDINDGDWPTLAIDVTPMGLSHDLTGDGASDIVGRDRVGHLTLRSRDESGGIAAPVVISGSWAKSSLVIQAGDLNRDGFQDVLERTSTGVVYIRQGTAANTWNTKVKAATGWNKYRSLSAGGDVDGDGRDDIIAVDSSGFMWLIRSTATNKFASPKKLSGSWSSWQSVAGAGDLDFDGWADIVVKSSNGEVWVYFGSPGGKFVSPLLIAEGLAKNLVLDGIGDFDGDGYPDVLARYGSGTVLIINLYSAGSLMDRDGIGSEGSGDIVGWE